MLLLFTVYDGKSDKPGLFRPQLKNEPVFHGSNYLYLTSGTSDESTSLTFKPSEIIRFSLKCTKIIGGLRSGIAASFGPWWINV